MSLLEDGWLDIFYIFQDFFTSKWRMARFFLVFPSHKDQMAPFGSWSLTFEHSLFILFEPCSNCLHAISFWEFWQYLLGYKLWLKFPVLVKIQGFCTGLKFKVCWFFPFKTIIMATFVRAILLGLSVHRSFYLNHVRLFAIRIDDDMLWWSLFFCIDLWWYLFVIFE